MRYFCDKARHLVCLPYSIENLHEMAKDLGIKGCWFHKDHYDIPKTRIVEIMAKCDIVSSKEIIKIIKNNEETFFNFLAYKGWEPSWSSNYLVSITSPEPFDDFPSFLIEWGKYRQAELELLC